jgi:hypothetical protein
MGTSDDVREKLRVLESCDGALLVDADPEAVAEHGIGDDGRHRALADILTARFGAAAPHAAWLDAEWSEPGVSPSPRP